MQRIVRTLLIFLLLAVFGFAAEDFAEIKKKAEAGNPASQYYLGNIYHTGDGVPVSNSEALRWYRLAAEQGLIRAQVKLGNMYSVGYYVPQDYAEAAKWRRKAAGQGDADAQVSLGEMYHDGEGVPKDYVQAHVWLNIAGAKGHKKAKELTAFIAKEMTFEQVTEAERLALELFPKLPKILATNIDVNSNPAHAEGGLVAVQQASHAQSKEIPRQASTSLSPTTVLTTRQAGVANIGIVGRDKRWSEYGEYLNEMLQTIQVTWYRILEESRVSPPRGSHVVVTFKINAKGETDIVKVEDADSGKQGVFSCQNAITYPQPYPKWSQQMIAALGDQQELSLAFYYQ